MLAFALSGVAESVVVLVRAIPDCVIMNCSPGGRLCLLCRSGPNACCACNCLRCMEAGDICECRSGPSALLKVEDCGKATDGVWHTFLSEKAFKRARHVFHFTLVQLLDSAALARSGATVFECENS